jgi:SAM-dependent methyltransferase
VNRQIIELSPTLSAGVSTEVEALAAMTTQLNKFANTYSPQQYWTEGISEAPYQYESLLKLFPAGARVLDVGVGLGQSSVYLAYKGYEVSAVEPSMVLCGILRDAAMRHGLNIQVVQGVAENLSRLGRGDFDVVLFNASLHHCDDPLLALAEAKSCLKKGGAVYLVNETMLKPWQSEEGFQRRLAEDPIAMGHYGGNEHAYHNSKYVRMLRTQFKDVEWLIPRTGSALDDLRLVLNRHIDGSQIHTKNGAVLARFIFYIMRAWLRTQPLLYRMLAKSSIVPVHFRALNQ